MTMTDGTRIIRDVYLSWVLGSFLICEDTNVINVRMSERPMTAWFLSDVANGSCEIVNPIGEGFGGVNDRTTKVLYYLVFNEFNDLLKAILTRKVDKII